MIHCYPRLLTTIAAATEVTNFLQVRMLNILFASLACILPFLLASASNQPSRSGITTKLHGSWKTSLYPPEDVPGPKPLPAWLAAYRKAKKKGLIPKLRPSIMIDGDPSYPFYSNSTFTNSKKICSWTVTKCTSPRDIVSAPRGKMGISFDDGPQPPTSELLSFLKQNNQSATHFMIGSRIRDNPDLLFETFKSNHDHIAVHTWSHPYMTTMSDMEVLGEIGWTMQIIYDLIGVIPAFWRPPYGDIDNRVRAISQHVFGLKTVMWSTDPNDWCLSDGSSPESECAPGSGPQNMNQLIADLRFHIHEGVARNHHFPKKGIISLEHELSRRTVQSFMETYPFAKSLGWDTRPIPDLFGLPWYQHSISQSNLIGILPQLEYETSKFAIPVNLTGVQEQTQLHRNLNDTATVLLSPSDQSKSPVARVPARGVGHGLKQNGNSLLLASLINYILLRTN